MQIDELRLGEARPSDRPHLLLWDNPDDMELRQLAYRNDAECVSYRTDLLSRIAPQNRFLALHHQAERELNAIRTICASTTKPIVLLKDLDYLITYLQVKSRTTLFWQNLFNTRHLESILWIILPSKLALPNWHDSRIQHIS